MPTMCRKARRLIYLVSLLFKFKKLGLELLIFIFVPLVLDIFHLFVLVSYYMINRA